jgi:hypothetical protein
MDIRSANVSVLLHCMAGARTNRESAMEDVLAV